MTLSKEGGVGGTRKKALKQQRSVCMLDHATGRFAVTSARRFVVIFSKFKKQKPNKLKVSVILNLIQVKLIEHIFFKNKWHIVL